MRKGARRWVVGLLAGGALAAAGCSGGEGDEADREGHAFETPQHRQDRPKTQDEAQPLGASNEHPASADQESASGQLPRGAQMGGGTAAPANTKRGEATGGLPRSIVGGLGTSLADAYQASAPGGGTATGGSGTEGAPTAPGGAASGSATPGTEVGSGAGSAGGGTQGGQQGRK